MISNLIGNGENAIQLLGAAKNINRDIEGKELKKNSKMHGQWFQYNYLLYPKYGRIFRSFYNDHEDLLIAIIVGDYRIRGVGVIFIMSP